MIALKMKVVLATTYAFQLKAHKFHWNVMGPDFAQYHDYLGELYGEVFGAVDMLAEIIRTTGELSPGSFEEFIELSEIISDESDVTNPLQMINELIEDNKVLLDVLNDAYEVSEEEDTFDISDALAGRIAAHRKHGWMLHSFLNKQQV